MSQAPKYIIQTAFATDETNQVSGRSTIRTAQIDIEHANSATSINAIIDNLNLIQRDDTKLKDGIVEPYALSESARAILAAKGRIIGDFIPNFAYLVGDLVRYLGYSFICSKEHTSSALFSSSNFMSITGDGSSLVNAQSAALSEASVLAYKNSALASSNAAVASATSATASQASATASQNSAANSASIATSSASIAQTAAASLLIKGTEFVSATGLGTSVTPYLVSPSIVINSYIEGQAWEVKFPVACLDNPVASVSGLPNINLVIISPDGSYQNAAALDISNVSTVQVVDVGAGVLKLWGKNPALDYVRNTNNRIINGGMMVVQAPNVTLSASMQYGAVDMMLMAASGTGVSGTITQVASTAFSTGYALGAAGASWTTGQWQANTRIEAKNVQDLNGKTITVQAKVLQDTGGNRTFAFALRKANSVDNFSTITTINASFGNKVIPTGVITSMSGSITLSATDAVNGLEVVVFDTVVNTVVNKNYYVGDWQLESGAIANSFQVKEIGAVRRACSDYYRQGSGLVGIGYATTATSVAGAKSFDPMRALPVVALSGTTYINASGAVLYSTDISGFTVIATGTTAGANSGFNTSWTASARL